MEPNNQQTPTVPPANVTPPQTPTNNPADAMALKMLSIWGIILGWFMPPIGLILSIFAYTKAKKAGQQKALALVGVIISSFFSLIMLLFFAFAVFHLSY